MNVPILKFFGYSINRAIGSAAAIGFFIAFFGAFGFLILLSHLLAPSKFCFLSWKKANKISSFLKYKNRNIKDNNRYIMPFPIKPSVNWYMEKESTPIDKIIFIFLLNILNKFNCKAKLVKTINNFFKY